MANYYSAFTGEEIDGAVAKVGVHDKDIDELKRNPTNSIVDIKTGEFIVINDASDRPLESLVINGNTTQDGTPTPENPIDLVSVENPVVTINGKNLLNKDNVTNAVYLADGTLQTNPQFTLFGFVPVSSGMNVTLSAKYIGADVEYLRYAVFDKNKNFISRNNGNPKSESVVISIEQDGFIRCSVSQLQYDVATAQLELGNTATEYEPYKSQTLSVPYTLNGVGDVRDYVDFERGVLVRKCNEKIFSGGKVVVPVKNGLFYMQLNDASKTLGLSILCNRYRGMNVNYDALNNNQISLYQDTKNNYPNQNWIYVRNDNYTTAEELKQSLVENPITVIYPLAIPTETPLTAEEIEAFKQLQSYYPITTITNNENAEMGVEYVADTKLYIDNKFTALNNAILNNVQ